MYPWQDYSGRLSPLKLAVFVSLFLPGLWTAIAFGLGWLQPRPFTEAIHQVGLWMLRFLFIALTITPLEPEMQDSVKPETGRRGVELLFFREVP